MKTSPPSPLNTGAVTSKIGSNLIGVVLGLPFLIAALTGIATGRIPLRGHSPASDAFFHITELYLLLLVLPCAAVVSAAMSVFVAPAGQGRRFAAGAFFYYAQAPLIFAVLVGSLLAYAGTGPLWKHTLGNLRVCRCKGVICQTGFHAKTSESGLPQ